jgi:predicted nucleic acid-binding protein
MNVLIDCDVLIDFLVDREPFTGTAKRIIEQARENIIDAYLAPHSISNIFYLLRKTHSVSERKQALLDICQSVSVVSMGTNIVIKALEDINFDNVEDCLQAECAKVINADYIVTRNIEDYAKSQIPAILPEDLLNRL